MQSSLVNVFDILTSFVEKVSICNSLSIVEYIQCGDTLEGNMYCMATTNLNSQTVFDSLPYYCLLNIMFSNIMLLCWKLSLHCTTFSLL